MKYNGAIAWFFRDYFLLPISLIADQTQHMGSSEPKNKSLPHMFTIIHIYVYHNSCLPYVSLKVSHWRDTGIPSLTFQNGKGHCYFHPMLKKLFAWRFSQNCAQWAVCNVNVWAVETSSLDKKYFLFEAEGIFTCDLIMSWENRIRNRFSIQHRIVVKSQIISKQTNKTPKHTI